MIRLCLVGSNVADSPSTALHNALLEAAGIAGHYEPRVVAATELAAFVAELRQGRYDGCNVTMPHKLSIAALCDRLRGDAALLGAVNTVVVDNGTIIGDNTDALGFETALRAQRLTPPPDVTALLLGAGGAAAAVTLALQRMGPRRVLIAARRREQVTAMANRGLSVAIHHVAWDLRQVTDAAKAVALVVNATPLDAAELPLDVRWLPPSCTVADVRYRPRPIAIVERALAAGLRAADGMEMLLQQALLSFAMWTGRDGNQQAGRAALLRALGA